MRLISRLLGVLLLASVIAPASAQNNNLLEFPSQSASPGGVPYFSSPSGMASTGTGSPGQILQSNGLAAPTWVSAGSGLPSIASGSILGAPCTTGTCSPSALSSDFVFNTATDTLTLGGAQVLGVNGFATIQPAPASIAGAAYGVAISGGQSTSTASGSRAGGVIIEGGLGNVAATGGTQTGAVTVRTGTLDIGQAGNFGATGLIKIYSSGTTTAGAASGLVELATGPSAGTTGNMLLSTGANTATSGTTGSGGFSFAIGNVNGGSTGTAGNFGISLPIDINTSTTASHGSFLITGGSTGVTAAQDYFVNANVMAGGIVFAPSLSACAPCTADGQVVMTNAAQTGGVAVDYKGLLELYSGLVDNNAMANYTTAVSGTNCTAIANQKGGPTAGSFTVTTGAANAVCTVTMTIGQVVSPALSVTGWVCQGSEATSGVALPQFQAALSTTSCTIKGTIATSGDLVTWSARGFH